MVSQQELEAKVYEYIEVDGYVKNAKEAYQSHRKLEPVRVYQFNCLDEMIAYQRKKQEWEYRLNILEDRLHNQHNRLQNLEQQIIEMLPVKNAWVKAGNVAVSFYYDTWGGGHYDLDIKAWEENMQPNRDKTEYP